MSENTSSASGGLSLPSLVFLLFLALKLLGVSPVAHWSWWWVTAPLWGTAAVVLVLCVFILLIQAVRR